MTTRLKFLAVTLALVSLTACSSLHSDSGSEPAQASSGSSQAEIQTETLEDANYYYDFGDILVPRELSFLADESYVFDTTSFKSGVMIFSGRVNNADLVNFFITSMTKDGWNLVTSLKAEKSILIFDKFNKSASIQIQNGFKSRVVIVAVEAKGGPGGAAQPKASGSTGSYSSGSYSGGASKGAVKEQDLR
ncbi:MAG TPA: hypothetical protein DDW80_01405 [Desulfovibrio sp.]|nr:hypothetical protein [Desulfovibrio sp.]